MPVFGFGGNARIHLGDRSGPAFSGKAAENLLGPRGWEERAKRLQEHPVSSLLHSQPGSGVPLELIPDRLRQDDLALCRQDGERGGLPCPISGKTKAR